MALEEDEIGRSSARPASAGTSSPGSPLKILAALLVLSGAVLGLAVLQQRERPTSPALVLKRSVAAYEQLSDGDLQLGTAAVNSQDVAEMPVAGRYTLRALTAGQPVLAADVSPVLPRAVDRVVVGVEASVATALGGQLTSGDEITLVATPTPQATATGDAASITAVLLSISRTGSNPQRPYVLVLLVRRTDTAALPAALRSSTLTIYRR